MASRKAAKVEGLASSDPAPLVAHLRMHARDGARAKVKPARAKA